MDILIASRKTTDYAQQLQCWALAQQMINSSLQVQQGRDEVEEDESASKDDSSAEESVEGEKGSSDK